MILQLKSVKVNISDISTEQYVRSKHNGYLYRHNIKYPISYSRLQYYHKVGEVIYKFKKSKGLSFIHKVDTYHNYVNKSELIKYYKSSSLYVELLELLDSLLPKFSKVIMPRDLMNPSELISDKSSELTLVINWFSTDNKYVLEEPGIFILNIFEF